MIELNPADVANAKRYILHQWRMLFGSTNPDTYRPSPEYGAIYTAINAIQWQDNGHSEDLYADLYDALGTEQDLGVTHSRTIDHKAEVLAFCLQLLTQEPAQLVMDGGCGTGLPLGYLASLQPQTEFVAYDVSAVAAGIAARRLSALGKRNAEIYATDHHRVVDLLPSRHKGNVDVIFIISSHARPCCLALLVDFLRPGGRLVINGLVPNPAEELGLADNGLRHFFRHDHLDEPLRKARETGDLARIAEAKRNDPRSRYDTEIHYLRKPA